MDSGFGAGQPDRLQDLGVARDVPVGICLEPGTELLVAMLAVLKAGGAYLPLDPAWPRERLQQMLGVVNPAVLISCARLRERCPAGMHELLAQRRAAIDMPFQALAKHSRVSATIPAKVIRASVLVIFPRVVSSVQSISPMP